MKIEPKYKVGQTCYKWHNGKVNPFKIFFLREEYSDYSTESFCYETLHLWKSNEDELFETAEECLDNYKTNKLKENALKLRELKFKVEYLEKENDFINSYYLHYRDENDKDPMTINSDIEKILKR